VITLSRDELKKYDFWIGKSAEDVYFSALRAGGWKHVFTGKMPIWASRVRNYFNRTPTSLERVTGDVASRLSGQVQVMLRKLECHEIQTFNKYKRSYRKNQWGTLDPPPLTVPKHCSAKAEHDIVHMGVKETIAIKNSLSGSVYKDETGRYWYQMNAGSSIYHYGNEPENPSVEAAYVSARGQDYAPVFKLVSPDNTGGSVECIITNPKHEDDLVAEKGKIDITKRIVKDAILQGSYNYSDTIQVGLSAHDRHDVKPHVVRLDFYVNPLNRFTPMSQRIFPAKDGTQAHSQYLATQE